MAPFDRPTACIVGVALVPLVLAGCGDDLSAAGNSDTEGTSSSTGSADSAPPTSSTGTAQPTTDGMTSLGADTSSTSGERDESGGESTGEATLEGSGRFVIRTGTSFEDSGLVMVESVDGVVGEPLDLLADRPDIAGLTQSSTLDDGRLLGLCWQVTGGDRQECGIIDLTEDPLGPIQSLASGAVPKGLSFSLPKWSAATQTLYFSPSSLPDFDDAGIFASQVVDGQLAPAQLVQPPLAGTGLNGFVLGADGQQLGFALFPADEAPVSYVTSTDPMDETPPLQVSAAPPPERRNSAPNLLPTRDAAYYAARYPTNLIPNIDSLWYVDLSGTTPGAPVRIDDPAAAPDRIDRASVAPDEHALAYWLGPNDSVFEGEIMFVELAEAGPQPPVRLSTLSERAAVIRSAAWSPDSRWLGYEAGHEKDDRVGLYLVDAQTGTPQAPVLASPGLVPEGRVTHWVFSEDARYVYMTAQIDSASSRLFRVDLSGDVPGAPQNMGLPNTQVDEELIFSHDRTTLLHSAVTSSHRAIAVADISTKRAGPSFVVNTPSHPDASVDFGARFSADDSLVAYTETIPERGQPRVLWIASASSPGLSVAIDGLEPGAIYPTALPR